MSKYTTEVRYLCETLAELTESEGYKSVNEVLTEAYPKVFDFSFPIYDEAYRPVLCKKILKHYYTREIGEETVGLWKLRLDMRLNEIMPYYNKLYESELIEFNPMYDTDLTKTGNKEGTANKLGDTTDNQNGSGTRTDNRTIDRDNTNVETYNDTMTGHSVTDQDGTTHNEGTEWNVYSDTPQGALTRVRDETYLTDARKITTDQDGTSTNDVTVDSTDAHTGTVRNDGSENVVDALSGSYQDTLAKAGHYTEDLNTTDEYLEHLVGKSSGISFSKMLEEYRKVLLNIDMMIINELSDLFMNVW